MKVYRATGVVVAAALFGTLSSHECAASDAPPGFSVEVVKEILIDTSGLPGDLIAPRMVPGDLTGDGRIDWVFFHGTRFIRAYSHNGELLWSRIDPDGLANPSPWHPWIPAVWDMTGDGRAEVVAAVQKDGFASKPYLTIFDGRTGDVLRERELWFTPSVPGKHGKRALISIGYLNGPDEPCILVGADDVLNQARAYDASLELLWTHEGAPLEGPDWWKPGYGHYILPHDVNGDGKEEVFIGKYLYDGEGNLIHDILEGVNDHVDSLAFGDFHPDYEGNEVVVCGAFGLRMYNINPRTFAFTKIWEIPDGDPIRDPQVLHVNRYDPDIPGIQIFVEEKWSVGEPEHYLVTYEGEVVRNFRRQGTIAMPSALESDPHEIRVLLDGGLVIDHRGQTRIENEWHGPLPGVYPYGLSMDVLGDAGEALVVWNRERLLIGANPRRADEQGRSLREQSDYLRVFSANRYLNRGSRFFDYAAVAGDSAHKQD